MVRKNVTVVYYWGGNICDDNIVGISYEGGQYGCVRSRPGTKYSAFLNKIHTATETDPSVYKIRMICRFPSYISSDHITYMRLEINDDDSLDAMLSAVGESVCLQSIDLYLEFDQLSSTYVDASAYPSPPRTSLDLNPDPFVQNNFDNQYASTSAGCLETQTPFEAVQNVVMNENTRAGCYERGSSDEEGETDVEGEDEIIMAIDNQEGEDEDDTDEDDNGEEVGPSSSAPRLHEPLSSFFSDIGDGQRVEYAPPGMAQSSEFDGEKDDLRKGLLFKTKELMKMAVSDYNIKRQKEYTVGNTNRTCWEAFCKNKSTTGCTWKLRGSLQKKHGLFEIVTYVGPHTCLFPQINQGHPQINAEFISNHIILFIRDDPSLKVQTIRTLVWNDYKYQISYYKAWYAKQKTIAKIFGDWEKSYIRLPKFMAALQKYNPGTIVKYNTEPTQNPEEVMFKRMFWSFKPCIDAFVHCRPVVCIDATHLYGKYKGKLLIALGMDANKNILPLAFGFVDEESGINWGWFLRLLRRRCVGMERPMCLISDRHKGILSAVSRETNGWGPPYGFHRYCLRHLVSNFMSKFKNNTLKKLVWQAAVQTQLRKFNERMQEIKDINARAYDWLMAVPLESWSFCHDAGIRWGETTTNVVECFNGVLKGARSLPITACVQIIFFRLVRYFDVRRHDGLNFIAAGVTHSSDASTRLQRYQHRSGGHHVISFNRASGEAAVTTRRGNTQVVVITQKSCTCGKWLTYKIPCSHALAVCRHSSLDSSLLIDDALTLSKHALTYAPEFHPLHHEDYWDDVEGPSWIPNKSTLRKGGRPRSSRFHNEMDVRTTNLCGLCRVPGHDRRTCPARAGQVAASRHL